MASITISDLRPAGSELFQDSESFLNELTDREMLGIAGGAKKRNISVGITKNNTVANTRGNYFYNYVKIGC